MNIAKPDGSGGFYLFTNQELRVGDHVFPLTYGYHSDDIYYVIGLETNNDLTGWPDDPHILLDLEYSNDKAYQVHTSKGFGPIEKYFRLIED